MHSEACSRVSAWAAESCGRVLAFRFVILQNAREGSDLASHRGAAGASGSAHVAVALACVLGVAAVAVAPWMRSQDGAAAPWLYLFFDQICHQKADRSFHLWGHPFAVCHRCSGLYLGFLIGFCMQFVALEPRRWLLARPRVVALLIAPLFIDAVVVPLFASNIPASRFGTGLIAAIPLGILAWEAVAQISGSDKGATGEQVANLSESSAG